MEEEEDTARGQKQDRGEHVAPITGHRRSFGRMSRGVKRSCKEVGVCLANNLYPRRVSFGWSPAQKMYLF